MAQLYNYSGNDDFRGWVSKNVNYANNPAGLLNVIGNDGKINWDKANQGVDLPYTSYAPGQASKVQEYVADLYGQWQGLKKQQDTQTSFDNAMALINAAKTPVPRMVNFDSSGAFAKAKEMATNAVSPLYQQKMTDFVNRQKVELARQQSDTLTGKSQLDQNLERTTADIALTGERTTADTATNIGDINATQAYSARNEGLNYNTAERALTEGLGASGRAGTGLGQQAIEEAKIGRNAASNEQVRQSTNQVEAAKTLMNRTFQDLETKSTRVGEDTTASKAKLDVDLERFIEDQAYDQDQETKSNKISQEAEIAIQTGSYKKQLVDQWIASLSGQGYNAQEIANAASIYG